MANPTTRALLAGVTKTRLALIRVDMLQLQANLARTMPGKMVALEKRLGSWAEVAESAAQLLAEMEREGSDG